MEHKRSSTDSRLDPDVNRHRFTMVATIAVVVTAAIVLIALILLSKFKPRCHAPVTQHNLLQPVYLQQHSSDTDAASNASHQSHDPLPVYEEEDRSLTRGSGIVVPTPAHVHSSQQRRSSDSNNDGTSVFGSVQYRGSRNGPQQTHQAQQESREAHESVDTLPPYDDPPSYTSAGTASESAQRMH